MGENRGDISNTVHHNIHIDMVILETELLMFLLIHGVPSSAKHAFRPLINSEMMALSCLIFVR